MTLSTNTKDYLSSLKRSFHSPLLADLRMEFCHAKESYRYGKINSINKDYCHIIPLSFLASLLTPEAFQGAKLQPKSHSRYNKLISLVTDPRNIVLADAEHNRNLGANIDWDLANQYSDQIESFIQDIQSDNIEPALDSKVVFTSYMSLIENYLKTIETNPKYNPNKKLKDFVNQEIELANIKGEYELPKDLYKNLLEVYRIYPSLAFYLQIFELDDSQLNDLFQINSTHMLMKYRKFGINQRHLGQVTQFCRDYVTVPYVVSYWCYLNKYSSFFGNNNDNHDKMFNQYLADINLDKKDLDKAINNHVSNLSDNELGDVNLIKYQTFSNYLKA